MDPCANLNYTYSYRDDNLCFETGYFGLKVDSSDFTNVSFGVFDSNNTGFSYLEALPNGASDRMKTQLVKEELLIDITVLPQEGNDVEESVFRMIRADETRLWESGKICQHYDFKQIKFDRGDLTGYDVTLYIVVWPDSMTFTLEITKNNKEDVTNEKNDLSLAGFEVNMKMKEWETVQTFDKSQIDSKKPFKTSLCCDINVKKKKSIENVKLSCSYSNPSQVLETDFSNHFNCFLLAKNGFINRNFTGGYTDIRDYDLFHIQVHNDNDDDMYVPILLFVQYLANPTGLCPIICDKNYQPTGIHIQLSKNWHNQVRIQSHTYSFTVLMFSLSFLI